MWWFKNLFVVVLLGNFLVSVLAQPANICSQTEKGHPTHQPPMWFDTLLNQKLVSIGNACSMTIVDACTMTIVCACTMIIVHARTMIIVYACTLIIVHACTKIIVRACTMIMVHACYMQVLWSESMYHVPYRSCLEKIWTNAETTWRSCCRKWWT